MAFGNNPNSFTNKNRKANSQFLPIRNNNNNSKIALFSSRYNAEINNADLQSNNINNQTDIEMEDITNKDINKSGNTIINNKNKIDEIYEDNRANKNISSHKTRSKKSKIKYSKQNNKQKYIQSKIEEEYKV